MPRRIRVMSSLSLLFRWLRTRRRTRLLRVRQREWTGHFPQRAVLSPGPQVCVNVPSVDVEPSSCHVVPQYPLNVTLLPRAMVRENHSFSSVIQGRNLILSSIDEPPPLRIFRDLPRGRSGIVDYVHPWVLFEPHGDIHHSETAFYVGTRSPWNWSHWLINFLPSVFAASQAPKDWIEFPLLLPNSMGSSPPFWEALSLIWDDRPTLVMKQKTDYRVEQLLWIDAPAYDGPFGTARAGTSSIFLNHKLFRNFTSHILQRLGLAQQENATGRYFFLRPEGFSRMANQSELLGVAENFGFQGVSLADQTFEEQVRLFSSASHIIAVDGSDLAGLIFAAEGVKVVELVSKTRGANHFYLNFYPNLAALRHGNIFQLASRETHQRESDGKYTYDPKRLRMLLSQLP